MRTRTAAALVPLLVAASVATVTAAAGPIAAQVTLPAASSPYRIGFARPAATETAQHSIFSAGPDGTNPLPNQGADAAVDDIDPAYSPDGSKIAYAQSTPGSDSTANRGIFVADADGSHAHQVTTPDPGVDDSGPTWSPDGKMIAFSRQLPSVDVGPPYFQIHIVVLASNSVLGPLTFPGWDDLVDPAWSPTEAETIVATGEPNNTTDHVLIRIAVAVTAGGVTADALTPLAPTTNACAPPAQINDVHIASVASLVQRDPALSPDGGTVAYLSNYAPVGAICLVGTDGTNPRPVPISNLSVDPNSRTTLHAPAFAPDGSVLALEMDVGTGPATGPSVLALTLNAPAATATSATQETWIANAAMPAFDLGGGPVALTVTVKPKPGYVGGVPVAVTFTLHNQSRQTLAGATLTATLPAVLPIESAAPTGCTPAACSLGTVSPGATAIATFRLNPAVAVNTLAAGTVTYTSGDGSPTTITGQGPLAVVAPTMTPNPPIGPPGIVTVVSGRNFPPMATVRFTWEPGISARTRIKVRVDGTFTVQMLVLPNDTLGPRGLRAHGLTGGKFGDVIVPFLVVPDSQEPPRFTGRG